MEHFVVQVEENVVEKPWAGNYLSKLKGIPGAGESWELSPHPKNPSIVSYKGETVKMSDIFSSISGGYDPLLIKFIDAGDKLSVQVHPSDEDAKRLGEKDRGKEEAWVALSNAEMMIGFSRDLSKEEFLKAVEELKVEELLNKVSCSKYDSYLIPPKTVHAICRGLIYEVSTCSDITYRVYDYGRGRELHLDKAIEVIDFRKCNPSILKRDASKLTGENFEVRLIRLSKEITREIKNDAYMYVSCVEGYAELSAYGESIKIGEFKTVFVPNQTDIFTITGSGSVLVAKPLKKI